MAKIWDIPRNPGRVATLDTGVKTHISVNTAGVASPPTTYAWTTNDDLRLHRDVAPPLPSLMVSSLWTTNDVSHTTAAVTASVA